ncbi:unnamed protein product, partial [Clonostachys rosea]
HSSTLGTPSSFIRCEVTGPFLAKFTDGYAGWYAIKKCLHLVTYRNHNEYETDIYLNQGLTKARSYVYSRMNNRASIFNAFDRRDHRRRRAVIRHAISEQSMRKFEPTMMSQVNIFLGQLIKASQDSSIVNMTPSCQRLAIDVVGHLAFGYSLNTQTEEKMRFLPDSMTTLNARLNLFMTWPLIAQTDPGIKFVFKKRIERLRSALAGMIKDRMALPRDAKHDLFSIAMKDESVKQVEQEGLRDSELWAEAGIFFTAGGSTTATAIATIFFYISQHQAVYNKLASEIRSSFASGSEIHGGPKLTGCTYLRAVVDETLRMTPPSSGTLWREQDHSSQTGTQPLIVDGHVIPPGTAVGVNTYSIHHNEEYFPEPFKFLPERWIVSETNTKENLETMRRAFVPFSVGERGCAGKAMAYLEINLVIAKTLWYFDLERAPGHAGNLVAGQPGRTDGRDRPDEYQLEDIFTADHKGPNLVFKCRGNYWEEL